MNIIDSFAVPRLPAACLTGTLDGSTNPCGVPTMAETLPRTMARELQFEHGRAIGISNRWLKGQYCSIITPAGIVGCGIYDLETPAEFDQAIAIAKGTPACPLVEPEDLFEARIVGVTPKAASFGIHVGLTGRQAVELMLQATVPSTTQETGAGELRVQCIDHVTLVVKDLERSRQFYVELIGMREIRRPAFSFAGLWFQAGATQIHLISEFAGSGPAGNLLPENRRTSRTQHLAFAVDDATVAATHLKTLHVPILSGPSPRPDGYIQVFLTDPDGHVIELCSPPKAGP
jgi:catechol 2,3-dioxygenase-like lactoylglutathione lyase family enzyme/uncharacterized protein YunC (DUF1805 family)